MDKLSAAQNLACGLFANPELFPDVSAITRSTEMPEGPTRDLFELFEGLVREGKQPTLESVAARMGKDLRDAIVQYHNVCISTSAENVLYYARQVHQRAVSETLGPLLINAGYEISDPHSDVLEELTEVRSEVEEALQGFSTGDSASTWQECLVEFLRDLDSVKPRFTRIGFGGLDQYIGGYAPGDFDVIAARSGGGKSDLAVLLSVKAAKSGVPVLYESLEMYRTELTERVVSNASGVKSALMRDKPPQLKTQMDAISRAVDSLYTIKGLTVDAPSRLTLSGLEAMINKTRPAVVFLDNLDLLSAERDRKDKWRQIEENCHALKSLAKRTKTCIVGLVQLNRTTDAYADEKPPTMADLYGGSSIEHDASWIVALRNASEPGFVNAYVLKSRAGRSGVKVQFRVDFDIHRWMEVDQTHDG